jgi:hypothetical protein
MTLAKAFRTRPLLIAALSLLALYALGLLYEMDWAPAGCCGFTWPTPNPAQAERLVLAKDPKGLDAAAQRKAAAGILAARPADANAWLRLAYADRLAHGKLTGEGRHAFEMSYLTAPYAAENASYRVAFALENWGDVSAQTRTDCVKEIDMIKGDYRFSKDLRASIQAVHNPLGRMAGMLMVLF